MTRHAADVRPTHAHPLYVYPPLDEKCSQYKSERERESTTITVYKRRNRARQTVTLGVGQGAWGECMKRRATAAGKFTRITRVRLGHSRAILNAEG